MTWISVKDRLPEYDRGVLAFGVDGLVIATCSSLQGPYFSSVWSEAFGANKKPKLIG